MTGKGRKDKGKSPKGTHPTDKSIWLKFIKTHKDSGLTLRDLREKHISEQELGPGYSYDPTADIVPDLILAELRNEYPIDDIVKKIEEGDEISSEEERAWTLALELTISDEYTLSKEQLLDEFDWWLRKIQYHGDIDGDVFGKIVDRLTKTKHKDIYEFLDDVIRSFEPMVLNAIEIL